MAEFDTILKKWTNPEDNYIHGASFVVYDNTAKVNDLCYLASQSKIISSVAVLQIVEKGLIGLDDDCRKIVPQLADKEILVGFEGDESATGKEFNAAKNVLTFKNPRKPLLKKSTKPITLRLLLSHSSGFAYHFMSEALSEYLAYIKEPVGMHNSIEKYNTPLIFEPGTSWAYSPGIDWAGRVLEIVTGQTLDQYMQENICQKVGMKNTTFFPDSRLDRLPPQMELAFKPEGPKGKLVKGHETMVTSRPNTDCLGGGGIYSTCEDFGFFLRALIGGGEPLLKRETLDKLFTGTVSNRKDLTYMAQEKFRWVMAADLLPDTEVDHSLGGLLSLTPVPGRRAAGSAKWGGMSNPLWWIDMKTGVGGAIFTQLFPAGDPVVNDCFVELETEVYKRIEKASL
ncbi:MAG: hypothetical protein Q9165_001701 [Trypethelium subeluteriae]